MGLKEEELQRAKEVALKFESELKEVTLKHTTVNNEICNNDKLISKIVLFFFFASYFFTFILYL